MTDSLKSLLAGTEVHARGLRWEIVGMLPQGDQTLVRLRGLEGVMQGKEMDLLHPLEEIQPIQHDLNPAKAVPLQNWVVYHQAFLLEQALGESALLSVQPGRLRIEPYQLVPVLRAIRMSRVRLLLADGVGLGKTIQAGMILTELIARRLAHRILIVSPAGPLMDQWRSEMRERFGLRLVSINRSELDEIRRSNELGSNPFDHVPLGIISIDFAKQDRILDLLDRATYDVVIIDEAHHCMDLGAVPDRDSSQRRKLASTIARNCDALLLLTATPHDGNDRSFSSICELLDPSLVDGRGALRGERYRAHVVRRLKRHVLIEDPETGEKKPVFPDRVVTPVPVSPDPERHKVFIELQRKLLDLIAPELRRSFRTKSYSDVLAWIALLKRSVSSVYACGHTLEVVANRFQHFLTDTVELQEQRRQRISAMKDFQKKLVRFGTVTAEEEAAQTELEAEDIAQQLAGMQREVRRGSREQAKVSDIVAHLDDLVALSEQAVTLDPKNDALASAIQEIRRNEPKANILVYTEYMDSQTAIIKGLKELEIGELITMNGEDDEKTRSAITERFRTYDGLILVSTDSASEGLNLHKKCHHLIHFELPFNPNRLEQRNGRIDRYGQTKPPLVRYLYLSGTFEERILLRLIAKYEKQRARLTFVPNTLGVTTDIDASNERLLKGLLQEDEKLFGESQTQLFDLIGDDEEEGADEATKELLQEIDRSLSGFKQAAKANEWLGESGLNAEEALMQEADSAHKVGKETVDVPLAPFVCNAVRLDGGDVEGRVDDPIFKLTLPPNWLHGLDEIEGYDPTARVVRLSSDLNITSDEQGHSVGYLGRAHPLVRRALDRVRNLSFGGANTRGLDQRVSVIQADVDQPQILYTFLGRISSGLGREYERVLAVMISKADDEKFLPTPDDWSQYTDQSMAIRTTDVWVTHFESWAQGLLAKANEFVQNGFTPIAKEFIDKRRKTLQGDADSIETWLQKRALEITGSVEDDTVQAGIFDAQPDENAPIASWRTLTDPADRLAAFHGDRRIKPSKRIEADGVLRLYKQRKKDIADRSQFGAPEIIPLGMLMIVPEDNHGV